MQVLRVTKEFDFEMAHALHGYDGKCANIHGHTYYLSVTVIGKPGAKEGDPKLGMVVDFSVLKMIVKEQVVDQFDHALVLKDTDPLVAGIHGFSHVIKTSYQPTCENLLIDFVSRIEEKIKAPLRLYSVCLRETNTSYASWFADDNL
ncbi:Queuosine biosynthesis QueD, PTPS-I [Fulvivirga imtechensis AK7]|uniref:6-carboxy-5,6,7,8-tetrahydropterin synthase n=1 Tax=Fulvivirga imtechensis AK7 TaxID=1237149 RepID=L8JSQ6_9BACT|nr:6-carboxytetrahydropterin synthase [Fulvivirga imtechensis]ELR72001.1 Queuosine biosynthesis QueD, PTPS-I [Fulvivirga imtechensis AK7]